MAASDEDDLRRQAEARVDRIEAFRIHLAIYVAVNALLWLIWAYTGATTNPPWPVFVTLGWGIGIVILGIILAYAATRSGRLRPGERARLDENTRASLAAHDQAERASGAGSRVPGMQSNTYALLIPIVVVVGAIALMLWSFAGDRAPREDAQNPQTTSQQTTGAAPKQSQPAAAAPTAPRNDTGSDSARGNGPLNKSR
jgi:hypothetical protein